MVRQFLLGVALATLGLAARAVPLEITYSSVVTQSSGTGAPAVGELVTGRIVFDSSASAYTSCVGAPQTAQYQARCLSASPYGSSISTSVYQLQSNSLANEVLDNDLTLLGLATPGDLISFSAQQTGIFYSLRFFGPTTAFAGTEIPTETLLQSLLPGAVVYGLDRLSAGAPSFTAAVTAMSVSAIPEPATSVALVAGLLLLAVRLRANRAA
jgi:hypothetical protein